MTLLVAIVIVYILPTVIALLRRHANASAIIWTNLLLGWTFVGWAAAFIWAWTSNVRPRVTA